MLIHLLSIFVALEDLRKVLEKFHEANLQMRIDKCKFGHTGIDLVGHHISGQGISPMEENVSAITVETRL